MFVAQFEKVVHPFSQKQARFRLVKYPHSTKRGNSRSLHALGPSCGVFALIVLRHSSPDLSSETRVVVNNSHPNTSLSCTGGGGHTRGTAADHQDIEPFS
jgi:hypothetical protein